MILFNLIIQATAVSLKINGFIYQENRGPLQILKHHGGQEGLHIVHLKFMCHPQFDIFSHFDAILISSRPDPSLHFI